LFLRLFPGSILPPRVNGVTRRCQQEEENVNREEFMQPLSRLAVNTVQVRADSINGVARGVADRATFTLYSV